MCFKSPFIAAAFRLFDLGCCAAVAGLISKLISSGNCWFDATTGSVSSLTVCEFTLWTAIISLPLTLAMCVLGCFDPITWSKQRRLGYFVMNFLIAALALTRSVALVRLLLFRLDRCYCAGTGAAAYL